MIYDRDSVLYERYMEAMERLQEVYDKRLARWQNKGQPPYEARFHFLPPVGEQGTSVVPAERNLGSAELWDMNDETVVRKAQELVKQLGKEHMVQSWTLVARRPHGSVPDAEGGQNLQAGGRPELPGLARARRRRRGPAQRGVAAVPARSGAHSL